MVHPSSLGAFTRTDTVRLSRVSPHRILRRIVSRGGNLLVRLRPARMLGLLSGPRRFTTGQPVYSRACSGEGLPASESAMTSRLNHLLPRQDFHLLACQRSKAALGPSLFSALAVPQGLVILSRCRARGAQLQSETPVSPLSDNIISTSGGLNWSEVGRHVFPNIHVFAQHRGGVLQ